MFIRLPCLAESLLVHRLVERSQGPGVQKMWKVEMIFETKNRYFRNRILEQFNRELESGRLDISGPVKDYIMFFLTGFGWSFRIARVRKIGGRPGGPPIDWVVDSLINDAVHHAVIHHEN